MWKRIVPPSMIGVSHPLDLLAAQPRTTLVQQVIRFSRITDRGPRLCEGTGANGCRSSRGESRGGRGSTNGADEVPLSIETAP